MSVNCIILGGITDENYVYPLQKTAGPYRIATELRSYGYTVQVIDISYFKKFDTILKKILSKFLGQETLWIGFSVNFLHSIFGYKYFETDTEYEFYKKLKPNFDNEIKLFINFCKNLNPNIKFLIGGVKIFDLSDFDFIHFQGHVDKEIITFTQSLQEDSKKITNNFIRNKEYLNFCKSNIRYIKNDIFPDEKTLPIEISRGCIFKCKFCSYPLNGKTKNEHIKDYDLLLDEFIYNYENFGITNYMFSDDTYNDSVQKITDLYNKVYSRLPFNLTFTAYVRLDLLHRFTETADILRDSGLTSAIFGIETLDPNSAKLIGKGVNPKILIDFAHELAERKWKNVVTNAQWIIGFPNETKKSVNNFVAWLTSDNNPFNGNDLHVLRIIPKEFKSRQLYQSNFDLTFDKNGYEFDVDEQGKIFWKFKNNELTAKYCENIINDLEQNNIIFNREKNRFSGFDYNSYLNLNICENDLQKIHPSILRQRFNIQNLIKEQHIKYIKNLMSITI